MPDPTLSAIIDDAVVNFDAACASNPEADLADFLPNGTHRRVVLICLAKCAIQRAWMTGGLVRETRGRVEYYTTRYPELAGDERAVVELVLAECKANPEADVESRAAQFSGFAGAIRHALNEGDGTPRIPGYHDLKEVGRGGGGVVYDATEDKLNRRVALKVIGDGLVNDPDYRRRFQDEARRLADLSHPHIVTIFAVGEWEREVGVFVPFISLERLAPLPSEPHSPADLRQFVCWLEQAARGLGHAHEVGVIHRDVTPNNIMIERVDETKPQQHTGGPKAKLIDFGLGKKIEQPDPPLQDDPPADVQVEGGTRQGTIIGTLAFMAPEQAKGQTATVWSDIYGIGAVLYKFLTGKPPHGETRLIDDTLPPRPQGSADLVAICLACMAPNPEDRRGMYASARDVADDLRRYIEGVAVKARPRGRVEKVARAVRTHARQLFAVAIGVVVVTLSLGFVGNLIAQGISESKIKAERRVIVSEIQLLLGCEPDAVPKQVEVLQRLPRPHVSQILGEMYAAAETPRAKRRLVVAIVALATGDQAQVADEAARLSDAAEPGELAYFAEVLGPHLSADTLKAVADRTRRHLDRAGINAAGLLAATRPEDPAWQELAPRLAAALTELDGGAATAYATALAPVFGQFRPHLVAALDEAREPNPVRRSRAADLLLLRPERHPPDPAAADWELDALLTADAEAFKLFLSKLDGKTGVVARLEGERDHTSPVPDTEAGRTADARRRTSAAVGLSLLSKDARFLTLLKPGPNPAVRPYLIERLAAIEGGPELASLALARAADAQTKAGLVMILGTAARFGPVDPKVVPTIRDWYATDPDPELHAACEWALRRLDPVALGIAFAAAQDRYGREDSAWAKGVTAWARSARPGDRRWFPARSTLGPAGANRVIDRERDFVAFAGPIRVRVGTPQALWAEDPELRLDRKTAEREPAREVVIPRSFAASAKEVTVEEFEAFARSPAFREYAAALKLKTGETLSEHRALHGPDPDSPVNNVSFYTALAYARWRSEQEGIPEAEWCVPRGSPVAPGMVLPADYLNRTGYRLLTEPEWEYACRAGTDTLRPCGVVSLLPHYARTAGAQRAGEVAGAVPVGELKPNGFGLFGMLGNVGEWVVDEPAAGGGMKIGDTKLVVRGGSFYQFPPRVRSAYRAHYQPGASFENVGFRLARTIRAGG